MKGFHVLQFSSACKHVRIIRFGAAVVSIFKSRKATSESPYTLKRVCLLEKLVAVGSGFYSSNVKLWVPNPASWLPSGV